MNLEIHLSKYISSEHWNYVDLFFQGGQNRHKSHCGGTEDEERLHLPGEHHGVVRGVLGEGGPA